MQRKPPHEHGKRGAERERGDVVHTAPLDQEDIGGGAGYGCDGVEVAAFKDRGGLREADVSQQAAAHGGEEAHHDADGRSKP